MRKVSEILSILTSAEYLNANLSNAVIDKLKFLKLGELLVQNIHREFYIDRGGNKLRSLPNKDGKPINFNTHLYDPIETYKSTEFQKILQNLNTTNPNCIPLSTTADFQFERTLCKCSDQFSVNLTQGTLISYLHFVNENAATENFYKIQRERKIWWMKFSQNPGRYFFSDLNTQEINGCKVQAVKIKSKFSFGELEVENVDVVPLRAIEDEISSDFLLMDPHLNKPVLPAVVRSTVCLEHAVLAILMDATEDSRNENINLNRKIAPFHLGVFCLSKALDDLATHLTQVVEEAGLKVLKMGNSNSYSPNLQLREFKDMDRIGIPYCIILDEDSLQTGVMKLRSRDTSLSEFIHVTDVPNYLLKIFGM